VLISYVVKHRDYRTAAKHGVNSNHFHIHKKEWVWIERFVTKYAKSPGQNSFKSRFPDFKILRTDAGEAKPLVEEVHAQHSQFVLKRLLERGVEGIEDRGMVDEVLRELHLGIVGLRTELDGADGDHDAIADFDAAYRYIRGLAARIKEHGASGTPTGYDTLDARTGGPMPGHLWVVGARLGQGKTWALVNMAVASVKAGYAVQFCSLEQPREQILVRAHTVMSNQMHKAAGHLKFTSQELTTGHVGPSTYRDWLKKVPGHYPGRLHVSDRGRGQVGPLEIASLIERNKPDVVFIDYMTLMSMIGDDWRAVQKLSGELKTLAMSYQVPIVTAAQLNRAGAGKRDIPGVENLAYGDSIGQDADAVIMLQQYSRSVHRVNLAKYRHGRDGITFWTKFLPNDGEFSEITYDQAQDMKDKDDDRDD
jgi:replicative DNA helicase